MTVMSGTSVQASSGSVSVGVPRKASDESRSDSLGKGKLSKNILSFMLVTKREARQKLDIHGKGLILYDFSFSVCELHCIC